MAIKRPAQGRNSITPKNLGPAALKSYASVPVRDAGTQSRPKGLPGANVSDRTPTGATPKVVQGTTDAA